MRERFFDFLLKVPFFRLLLFYILGVYMQYTFAGTQECILVCLTIGILFLSFSFFPFIKRNAISRWSFGFATFLVFFSLGSFNLLKIYQKSEALAVPEACLYQAEVLSAKQGFSSYYTCEVKMKKNISEDLKLNSRLILYLEEQDAVSLKEKDILLFHTSFSKFQQTENLYQFDYVEYLKKKGVFYYAYLKKDKWTKVENKKFSLRKQSVFIRDKLLGIYEDCGIKDKEYAVLAALTLGFKDTLEKEVKDSFSSAGVSHVLAVSGLHVGIVFLIIDYLFSFLRLPFLRKYIKPFCTISLLWLYAFITGMPPSVMRAAFMLSLVSLSAVFNAKTSTYNNVFFSAFILLLFQPLLLFDVGFQLSYIAVLSILFLQGRLYALFVFKNKFLDTVWSLFTVSLAAQIGTLPVTLYYFHQFPTYFWFSNLIVVPLVGFLIYLAVSLLFFHWIPLLGSLIAFVLNKGLSFLNAFTDWIQSLPYSLLQDIYIEKTQVLFLFLLMLLFSIAFFFKHAKSFIWALVFVLFFILSASVVYYNTYTSDELIVLKMKDTYAWSFVKKDKVCLFSENSTLAEKQMQAYIQRNKIKHLEHIENKSDECFFSFSDKKILFLKENIFANKKSPNQALRVDYLILTHYEGFEIDDLSSFILPEKVIADATFTFRDIKKIETFCNNKNWSFYSVKDKGTYVDNF